MQKRTQRSVSRTGLRKKQDVEMSVEPENSPGYLVTGLVVGVVSGVLLGTLLTVLMGERSLLFVQHLWNRLSGVDTDSEHVHFEWLLQ